MDEYGKNCMRKTSVINVRDIRTKWYVLGHGLYSGQTSQVVGKREGQSVFLG